MIACKLFPDSSLHETVEGLIMRYGIDCGITVKFRCKSDIEIALICRLRFRPFFFAEGEIVIDRLVKIADQFLGRLPFIRNQRTDTLHFSEENAICFRELNTSHIAFIFHRVVQMIPSSFNSSNKFLT